MLMDEGMDTGPVLLQEETEIGPGDTAGSLLQKLSKTGADLLMPAVKGLENGSIKAVPQSPEASYAPIFKKADGLIDWSKSAEELNDFIRGMNPWPGAYSFIDKERFKILKAVPVYPSGGDKGNEEENGVIVRADKDMLLVNAGNNMLSILEIQPPGKPVMPVKAFLQGRKLKEGMVFNG
jgi:methionyl-tRNA formyltransferase